MEYIACQYKSEHEKCISPYICEHINYCNQCIHKIKDPSPLLRIYKLFNRCPRCIFENKERYLMVFSPLTAMLTVDSQEHLMGLLIILGKHDATEKKAYTRAFLARHVLIGDKWVMDSYLNGVYDYINQKNRIAAESK